MWSCPRALAFGPSDPVVVAQRLRGRSRTPRRTEGEALDYRDMVGGG